MLISFDALADNLWCNMGAKRESIHVQVVERKLPMLAIMGATIVVLLVIAAQASTLAGPCPAATLPPYPSPTACVYLPFLARRLDACTCPLTSTNQYTGGTAYQDDQDDPVRPAYDHADKNLKLRGYASNIDADLQRELVNYGTDDPTLPPQFATMFNPHSVPPLSGFYRVYNWNWASSPEPGSRGDPITSYPVTALGLQTAPGEPLYVPTSAYDIGGGMEVLVLFADESAVALRYTREDSSASQGYTLHVDSICTDPNLLALYNALDDPDGPRYQYHGSGYTYDLPTLAAGQPFGTAKGIEIMVAIVDTGQFMDPRSCNEWWQVRPGYEGGCPGAR